MITTILGKVSEWAQDVVQLVLFVLVLQLCINGILLLIVRRVCGPDIYISFRIWGKSVRRLRIVTSSCDIQVGKVGFTLGKKIAITLRDINVEFLKELQQGHENDSKYVRGELAVPLDTLDITLDRKMFWFINKVFPIYFYFQLSACKFTNGTQIKIDLSSIAITKVSKQKIRAELFLHSICNIKKGDTIHNISYQLKCDIQQKKSVDGKKCRVLMKNWSSFLRLNGLHLYLDEVIPDSNEENTTQHDKINFNTLGTVNTDNINGSKDPKRSHEDQCKINSENNKNLVTKYEAKLHVLFQKYKVPIELLKIVDIKIEDLIVSYKHFVHFNVSSIQLHMETVDIYSYGVNLEFLPTSVLKSDNHEISVSVNTFIVDVKEVSAVRIPFINNVIVTDIISFLAHGKSIADAKVSYNMSIINPSIVMTIKDVLDALNFLKRYKEHTVDKELSKKDVSISERLPKFLLANMKSLPSFILKPAIWNFSSTLQFSNDEHLAFKFYSIQALLHYKNTVNIPTTNSDFKKLNSREELEFIERDPFRKQVSNYVKISNVNLSFMKLPVVPTEPIITIPICGFERSDTFLDDKFDERINVNSTLRHLALTLDNIDVLRKVHRALYKIINVYYMGYSPHPKKDMRDTTVTKPSDENDIPWSLRLRLKDLSCSLLLANFLPHALDPLGTNDFNMSDISRGMIFIMKESFIIANRESKTLKIVTASLIRVMEDSSLLRNADSIVDLKDLCISIDWSHTVQVNLPDIELHVDITIIWLMFYIKSVVQEYSSFGIKRHSERKMKGGVSQSPYSLELDIGKILLDITLPQNTPLLCCFESIHYGPETGILSLSSVSAFVTSVYVKEITVQIPLLSITGFELEVSQLNNENIKIRTASIIFHTEYHFRFYMIVDNLINMFKSFKQIKLAFSKLPEFQRLLPSQQIPSILPSIDVLSDQFIISVEEDPFEQELGLILKVGILEQRERLEKLQEFDEQKKRTHGNDVRDRGVSFTFSETIKSSEMNYQENSTHNKAFKRLLENFSTSWIARYRTAKVKFHGKQSRIIKRPDMGAGRYFYSPLSKNTVGKLVVKELDLKIGAPSFPIAKYADFIYKYGKGVPRDRVYTLLLIMGLDIRTGLWELRLRDYPLPAVSFPDTHTIGDLVFGEKMPENKSLRTVYVPFVPSASKSQFSKTNSIYGSHIIRTMNSIKTFFHINTKVESSVPAYITWGKSLQPGYISLMLWFDYLTRPQEDPSPKMGFWDKFRFLLHGKWTYHFSDVSKFHLNIKGSQHPYKVADDGAGLSFCWSGGTTIHIHRSADPKELLNIESKQFQLAVRDFTSTNKFDKILMKLAGHVIWKLGLLFEQGDIHKAGEEPRTPPCKPHYQVELVNPSQVPSIESYDSYRDFRSDFIHMSIGVYSSEKGSSNNLYLAPHSVYHFLDWWNLFHTFTSGPIRQGPLFTDLIQNSMKFGRSLFTITYQLHLEPLILTHVYRQYTDFSDTSNVSFTGLKGRVQSLRIDLHQKRVKLTHTNEKLKKSKPIWKFKMSTGEIDCTEADVRILSAVFDQNNEKDVLLSKLGLQPNVNSSRSSVFAANERELRENEWYDFEDYVDLDQVTLESSALNKLEAIPLLYSPRISYFRKINDDGYYVPFPFGNEHSHDCMIGKNHPERTQKHLVRKRISELENDIKRVLKSLEATQNSNQTLEDREANGRLEELNTSLHELKHRLHITHIILEDLKLSEVAPSIYSDGDSESSIDSSMISGSYSSADNSHLVPSTTIESFRSMRQASTLQVNSTYDNRFIVHNIQFKINKVMRQHLLEYASNAFERKSMRFFLTYKSVMILKELLSTALVDSKAAFDDYDLLGGDDGVTNAEFIQRFEELIREVPSENFDFVDSYLFRLISPQLQFMSDVEPNDAVILTARDIEMGIIDIMQIRGKSGQRIAMDVDTIVETRYCAVSKDIQLFTLSKEDILSTNGKGFHKNGYGMHEESKFWPPWIPLEMCYDGSLLEKHVFLKKRSMFFTYTLPNLLFFTDKEISGLSNDAKFRVGFPGLILNSTSQQYCVVYNVAQDLLSFQSTLDEKIEKLAKVILADEVRNNLEQLDVSVVTNLQRKVKDLYYTREFLKVHNHDLYFKMVQKLTSEIQTTLLELSVLMTAIKKNYDRLVSGSKSSQKKLNWYVGTDELIWELYDDRTNPFMTIGLGPSKFLRSQTSDGLNSNIVTISTLQCFNQQMSPVYLELLAPFEDNSKYDKTIPMVEIFWKLGPPVGGISDLDKMIVSLQPILFKMDHLTSEKIMNYLFPAKERAQPILAPVPKQPAISSVLNPQGIRRSSSRGSIFSDRFNYESKDSDAFDTTSVFSSSDISSIKKRKPKKITTSILNQPDENINEMVRRSGTFFNVKSIIIKKTIMSVCYKGAHHVLTDVNNLIVKVPTLDYYQKIWSRDEFFAALKRDITRVVVQHLGNIIGNKFVPHKKENKIKASMDISQLLRLESPTENSSIISSSRITKKMKSRNSATSSNRTQNSKVPTNDDLEIEPFFPEATLSQH